MPPVVIYTKSTCPYCHAAKALLHAKGAAFEEISVDGDRAGQAAMAAEGRMAAGRCRRFSSAARMSAAATICTSSTRRASSMRCWRAEQ